MRISIVCWHTADNYRILHKEVLPEKSVKKLQEHFRKNFHKNCRRNIYRGKFPKAIYRGSSGSGSGAFPVKTSAGITRGMVAVIQGGIFGEMPEEINRGISGRISVVIPDGFCIKISRRIPRRKTYMDPWSNSWKNSWSYTRAFSEEFPEKLQEKSLQVQVFLEKTLRKIWAISRIMPEEICGKILWGNHVGILGKFPKAIHEGSSGGFPGGTSVATSTGITWRVIAGIPGGILGEMPTGINRGIFGRISSIIPDKLGTEIFRGNHVDFSKRIPGRNPYMGPWRNSWKNR